MIHDRDTIYSKEVDEGWRIWVFGFCARLCEHRRRTRYANGSAAAFDGSALIFLIPFNERHDEDLLMRAMVQTFLDKSLCIAEETNHASEEPGITASANIGASGLDLIWTLCRGPVRTARERPKAWNQAIQHHQERRRKLEISLRCLAGATSMPPFFSAFLLAGGPSLMRFPHPG
jgi:hypothetical protein